MNVVAQMLVDCQSNGGIYVFVLFHNNNFLGQASDVACQPLHWNIAVLLGWQGIALCGELCETAADAEAGVAWLDAIVDVAILCSLLRSSEEIVVLFLLLGEECLDILSGFLLCLGFLGAEHCNGTRGAHNGDFG